MSDIAKQLPNEWVDQIPTQPSRMKALTVSIAAAALFGLCGGMWLYGSRALSVFYGANAEIDILFSENGLKFAISALIGGFGIVGVICLVAGLASLLRIRITYWLLRFCLFAVYPVLIAYVIIAWVGIFAIVGEKLTINGADHDRVTGIILWWKLCWPALATAAYTFWLQLMLRSRSVFAAFTGKEGDPMVGDRALEDWRTHGRDPRARRSLYWSILTHIFVIIVIPWLLQARGCVEPYHVPKGSGQPKVAVVMTKVKKPKKKKKLKLRKNSAIIFKVPDLFDVTDVDKVMDEQTQNRYAVVGAKGKLGAGGGTKGGFPWGKDDGAIRFIRMEHSGRGWDDGMNHTGADTNFLHHFNKTTGLKTRRKGESHSIALLKAYPKDAFPPFVYLTGNHNIGRISGRDSKILREYCLGGGMLIGDAGSGTFDRSFRYFVRQVFPGKPLIDIPDDDMIYMEPTEFPNGAPAFWHHGGRRALGIKHEGRWIVFYHPGDMNDAWKSSGYTDVTPEMRRNAMQLGINLVYYACMQRQAAIMKARRKKKKK